MVISDKIPELEAIIESIEAAFTTPISTAETVYRNPAKTSRSRTNPRHAIDSVG
jgi:hypothetical protein